MRNFLKSCNATAAIENAIVLPILILVILGIMEFGLTMFYSSSLNLGIRTVGRQGVAQGYNDLGEINNIMSDNLGGLYNSDPTHTTMIIRTYDNFDNMADDVSKFHADPASFFPTDGTPAVLPPKTCPITPAPPDNNTCQDGQIVLYGVKYKWGGVTGLVAPFVPDYLYSFSVVRNESFD